MKNILTGGFLILVTLIWFSGCKETDEEIKNSVIDLSSISNNRSIYKSVTNLKLIEVKSDFIFRDIFEIWVDDDGNVYMKDFISTLSRGILKIDSAGNEIFRITNKGKGPEEFLCIDAFTLYSHYLIYFDCLKKRFVFHDINTGQFVKAVPYDQGFINKIASLKNQFIVVENNRPGQSNLSIINAIDLRKEKTILQDNDNFKNFYGTSLANYHSDRIIFKNSLKDTLYIIKNDKIAETIYLNFKNDPVIMQRLLYGQMPPEDRIKIYQSSELEKVTSNILPFSNHIVFKSLKGNNAYFNLLNLNNKTCERFRLDDEFPFPLFVKNKVFYSVIDGVSLQRLINKELLIDPDKYNKIIAEDKTYVIKFQLNL